MPHDVIMPALGMAQDTGRLVSWRKQPGEAVAEGDPLFEVETDKAVMEVEAQADGFLCDVSAAAGDDVPVGSVVATIAETAGHAASQAPAAPEAGEHKENTEPYGIVSGDAELPDGKTVIMPALGMAQDTGKLVKWRRSPGDAVSATDILFEVETDKSVMEVEAGHDGYIAACLALEGEDVPVGSPAAIITAEKPVHPIGKSVTGGGLREKTAANAGSKTQRTASAAPVDPATSDLAIPRASGRPDKQAAAATHYDSGERILASPKAKWLAHEQGLDLARLAGSGAPKPYHAKDIETLASLAAEPAASAGTAVLHIQAGIPASGLADFVSWMLQDGGIELQRDRIMASFAAGAFRSACGPMETPLVIQVINPDRNPVRQADPDLVRLSQLAADDAKQPPVLIIRDLGQTDIAAVQLSAPETPVISICENGEATTLCLDFTTDQLSEDDALGFIGEFAARLKDPLRHLL